MEDNQSYTEKITAIERAFNIAQEYPRNLEYKKKNFFTDLFFGIMDNHINPQKRDKTFRNESLRKNKEQNNNGHKKRTNLCGRV